MKDKSIMWVTERRKIESVIQRKTFVEDRSRNTSKSSEILST